MTAERLPVALVLVAGLTGCGGKPNSPPAVTASEPTVSASGRCPVTAPGGSVPAASKGFNYGNGSLGVVLWPEGTLLAGRLQDGSNYAEIQPDGSIVAKLGWWRAIDGQLSIAGERLDGSAPPVRADVPGAYGSTGFQPTRLAFPTEGCWRVVGTVGRSRLAFVVRVRHR